MEDEEDIVASLSSEKRELRSERPEESLQQCDTLSTAVEEIDQLKEVVEVHDELAGEGDGVRGLESENEVENVEEEPMEARDDLLTVDEGQVESVERVNEGENVEKAKDMEGEQVKEGGKDAITEEMKDDKKDGEEEALGSAKEVKRDGVVKAAEVPLMNEEVIAKDEGIVGEEREASSCANEVETDGIVNAEDVEIVDEKEKAVNVVELGEVKAEIDEQGKELKVEEDGKRVEEEEEAEEMDHSSDVTKNDESVVEEGTPIVDTEMETETETMKSGSGGKRKRGPKAKQTTLVKASSRKIVGEDVCFICLDGGNLVLCDRRGCPKAYHPSCVDHDDEFFKTKGRWNCGWHLCNQCGKNAYFMCYTCQFSLCKSCSKDAAIFCVRGNKGFCETCMKTVRLIEDSKPNDMGHDAFSDKSSWEYLFKDYWLQHKEKLCIATDELSQAKNPWTGSDKHQTSIEVHEGNNDAGGDSDSSLENKEFSDSKRKKSKRKSKSVDYGTDSSSEKDTNTGNRKSRRRLKSQAKDVNSDSEHSFPDTSSRRGKKARRLSKSRSKGGNYRATDDFAEGNIEWASKELLEFVMHMKNGDQSVLTQFDVQGLLLEYIKRNELRDPRRQSQIICDSMLQKLFGKPRVGHFEMLKLLESHFFLKDNSYADDNQGLVTDTEIRQLNADDNTDSLLDGCKGRGRKSRKRGEERGSQSNLDDYAAIDMHNISLIFLRRNLMEALMGNSETFHDKAVGSLVRIRISGSSQKQDMYRLVQIIGTSKAAEPYKMGKRTTYVMLEILNLDKTETISIDSISNQEFSEDECKRLRQSIKCGLINRMTVGDVLEKAKELHEVRVVDWLEAEIVRLSHLRDRASEKGRKKELRECVEKLQLLKTPEERQRRLDEIPKVHADPKMDPNCESEDELDSTRQARDERPRETGFTRRGRDRFSSREGGSASSDSWSANARPPNQKLESNRNSSGMDFSGRREGLVFTSPILEHTWSNGLDMGSPRSNSREKPRMTSGSGIRAGHSGVRSDLFSAVVSESPSISSLAGPIDLKVSETEKMWHYRDPTGKVQGPFSMTQLRKWNSTGYFPSDLRIWRTSQSENDSILLTDLLAGRFDKEVPSVGTNLNLSSALKNVPTSIDTSKLSGNARSSGTGGRYESSNLPSPTPTRNSFQSCNQSQRGVERLPSHTPTSSDPTALGRSNFSHQSKRGASGNRGENFASSVQLAAGQHSFSSSGPRLDLSSSSGAANGLQIASRSTVQMATQPFTAPNSVINHSNLAQGLSNVIRPVTGQNPPFVYTHGWSSGYVARPENVSINMTPNNPNSMLAQVAYGEWTASTFSNQATSYGAAGYTGPGTIATNLPGVAAQNAWRPASTNMQWAGPGHQQQIVNQNMVWAGPPQELLLRNQPEL